MTIALDSSNISFLVWLNHERVFYNHQGNRLASFNRLVKTFSDRLRHARLLRGHTQKELARIARLSQSAIGSYESGQRQSSRSLRKIAIALKIEPEWLETGKGPMEPPTDAYDIRDIRAPSTLAEPSFRPNAKPRFLTAHWPYPSVPPSLFDTLNRSDKLKLEAITLSFIQTCHAQYGTTKSKPRRGG